MKLAILGTRGIPANYGGFETFAEELSTRLAARGHDVTVYGRSNNIRYPHKTYRGVTLVILPTIATKHLDTIAHTIRERVRIKGQIRALTASQRMSGNVISLLPVAVGIFLALFNPNYVSSLWSETCGIVMLLFGAVTIIAGYLALRKITDIEV